MISSNYKSQTGYTLIEIALVLIIIASLAVLTSKFFFRDLGLQTVDQTAEEIALIQRAALIYFAKNNEWPDQDRGCANAAQEMGTTLLNGLNLVTSGTAPSLTVTAVESPWYGSFGKQNYSISCANNFSLSVSVSLEDQDKKYLERMLIKIPLSKKAAGNTVKASVVAPSSIFALNNYIKRTKVDATSVQNTLEAGFNINGKLKDFQVGSCIADDVKYTGACRDSERHLSDSIFTLDPDATSVMSELMLIPPKAISPVHDENFTLNLCDSGRVANQSTLLVDTIDCSTNDTENPAWSIKANDVYITSKGKYLTELKSSLREWIHIKHYDEKKEGDEVKRPKCQYISDDQGNWGYYEPVIIIKPAYMVPDDVSDFIQYGYYRSNWSRGRYRKWTIDIDIDYENVYLSGRDELHVSVDTYCVTTQLYTENEDENGAE